ncbi:MAG TPA: hypothetical protein VGQ53_16290, partial [Chitinophagaceae bacterium]|nr:hypothetical protein [Chitinophagaceae bacterium]
VAMLDELTDMTVLADTSFIKNGKLMNKPFPQLRIENGKLTTFFNKILIFRLITSSYIGNNLVPQLENSKRLIEFLKNKYNIQN